MSHGKRIHDVHVVSAIATAIAKIATAYYAQTATPLAAMPETVVLVIQAYEQQRRVQ